MSLMEWAKKEVEIAKKVGCSLPHVKRVKKIYKNT